MTTFYMYPVTKAQAGPSVHTAVDFIQLLKGILSILSILNKPKALALAETRTLPLKQIHKDFIVFLHYHFPGQIPANLGFAAIDKIQFKRLLSTQLGCWVGKIHIRSHKCQPQINLCLETHHSDNTTALTVEVNVNVDH